MSDGEAARGARRSAPSGGLSLAFAVVALASGLVLVPFYDPARAVEDVEALQGGIPFGFALRALHCFAGAGLLVATLVTLVAPLAPGGRLPGRERPQPSPARQLLGALVAAVALGLVVTGAWLRGEAPIGLELAYLHHAGTLSLLLGLLATLHARRLVPDPRSLLAAAATSFVLAAALPLRFLAGLWTALAGLLGAGGGE